MAEEKATNSPIHDFVLAVNAVMTAVTGIDKEATVGTGQNAYKGMRDKDVKMAVSKAMRENGLIILPTSITPKTTIERWEEESSYGKKIKQSVMVETTVEYKIIHKGGHFETVSGFGQGIDTQDKAAGKATTYSLKNLLRYMFLIADEKIDDTDNTHSDELPVPPLAKPVLPMPSMPLSPPNPPLDALPIELITEVKEAKSTKELIDIKERWPSFVEHPEFVKIGTEKFKQISPNVS